MLPYEWALATQFLAFTGLYFVDSTVTTRGWTPHWYATYRFVLTFIVGASIVISLIGRGEIGDKNAHRKLPSAVDRIKGQDRGDLKRAEHEEQYAKIMDKKSEEQAKQREQEEKEKEEEEKRKEKESKDDDKGDDGDDKKDAEGKDDSKDKK
jgi:Protein of unknown function (DUF3429)